MKEKISKIIFETLGEASALFMSRREVGTSMEMPTDKLKEIGDRAVEDIIKEVS